MNSATSISLLERIKDQDEAAWVEFSGRYVAVIEKWCQAWSIQHSDAQDVIQDTMLAVLNGIRNFDHRGVGSFRAWMKTIAWRCWCEIVAKAERLRDKTVLHGIKSIQACQQLQDQFDKLASEELLQMSVQRARVRAEQTTWLAFRMTALEARPVREVAEELKLTVEAVYAARCRMQRWITEEFIRLDEEG